MIWDWLVQRTGKYCSIRRIEYPEFQTGIFGRMESAPSHLTKLVNMEACCSLKSLVGSSCGFDAKDRKR